MVILTDALSGVRIFIQALSLPLMVASDILTTMEDCNCFYTGYYGRNKYVVDDLYDFREHKIKNSINCEMFLDMCFKGEYHKAFELLFCEILSEQQSIMINNFVNSGSITYESMFDKYYNNPNLNIWKMVL